MDGSVSSFNLDTWIIILVALAGILGGSLWLKKNSYPVIGIVLLLILAIPGVLYGFFILLTIVTNSSWN